MQLIKEYIRENKKVLLVIIGVIIILSIISIYINNQKNKKVYMSDDYVFTKESYEYNEYIFSELPYINIKGDEIQKINNELLNQYYEINELQEKMMKYDYYISDNILSLIVKVYYIEAPDVSPSLSVYNVDMDSLEVLYNNELLTLFNISNNEVIDFIRSDINDYYNYEIRNDYISNDCNFDCYLSRANSLPLDKYELYVKDNILYAYKDLKLDRDFYYDIDSGFNLFHFKIVEK